MNSLGWILLAAANTPVYCGLAWLFFKDTDEFLECLRAVFTHDIIAAFRGEYFENQWAVWKFGLWVAACVACVVAEGIWLTAKLG